MTVTFRNIRASGVTTAGSGMGSGYVLSVVSLSAVAVGMNIGGILMRLIAILVSSLLLASTAHARTWQINLIQSHGFREVSRQDSIGMLTVARAKLAEAGIRTRVGRVSYSKLANPAYGLLTYQAGVFFWAKALGPRRNILRHVLTPPFFDEQRYWIAGVSIGVCTIYYKYAVTTSNAQLTNIDGVDFWYKSAIAMTHELGHAFGAKHTKSRSIMNVGSLAFEPVQNLVFAPESIRQINQCAG